MLYPKHPRTVRRKTDWFSAKVHPHFDGGLSREAAERLVSDPVLVAAHQFLPLISFEKRERRFRRARNGSGPKVTVKKRALAYPANRDGYIFSYYAGKLGQLYETELEKRGLGEVVVGYRKGRSNIQVARAAFEEIRGRGDCVALALDVKELF